MKCPDDSLLAAYVENPAAPHAPAVDAHLDACTRCRTTIARLHRVHPRTVTLPPVAGIPPREDPLTNAGAYCPSCNAAYDSGYSRCPADGAELLRLQTVKDQLIGQTLKGGFEIRERIGAGGMGTVYRAWQHSVGREVAVKVINSQQAQDMMGVRRFLREARLASQLSQPNIVSVVEFGQTEDGHLFMVMELLKGRTIGQAVKEDGPFDLQRTVRLGVQICDALEAAHGLSIVHRDIKPSNILLLYEPPGRDLVKVLDFGLAKSLDHDETQSTQTGNIIGTPRFMSPETLRGAGANATSDLYSLGVILHEVVTGRPLFDETEIPALLLSKLGQPPIASDVPAPLRRVLAFVLHPEPAQRCPSAAQLRAELLGCVAAVLEKTRGLAASHGGVAVSPATHKDDAKGFSPGVRESSPRRAWIPIAAVLGVAVVAALGALAFVRIRADHPTRAALEPVAIAGKKGGGAPALRPASGEAPEAPAQQPIAPGSPAPQDAASAPALVEIDFRSAVPVSVQIGAKIIGTTPARYEVEQSDRAFEVSFHRRGFLITRQLVVPTRSHTVAVQMVKRKPSPTRPRSPRSRPHVPAGSAARPAERPPSKSPLPELPF